MSRFHTNDWDMLPERSFRQRPGGGMTLEGGKGSDVPAPDPALIAAQIKSMGIQDSAIDEILRTSRDMKPLQMAQMQFGLDTSRTAYEQSQADRGWMLERRGMLSGVQDSIAKDAKDFNEPSRQEQLAAEAGADVNAAFSNARGQQQRAMSRTGVNPGSGKFAAMSNQLALGQAATLAGATNKTRQSARLEGMALTDRANNALAGYPAMGMQATGAGAGYGSAGLGLANNGLAGMNSGMLSAGGMAGNMGQNASSMFGQQANYKLNSDAAANAADPFASLLGAGAQLGAAYIGKPSDRRLKQDIVRVGTEGGLPLYEFAYRANPARRYRGVMADEVLAVMPDAVLVGEDGFMRVDYGMLGIDMVEVTEVAQ